MKEPVRPYGDRRDDGMLQLSFVLPVPPSERAREAARRLLRELGLEGGIVATMEAAGEGFTFFVCYGRTRVAVDLAAIEVPEAPERRLSADELDAAIARDLGRRIVVVGGCTGTDAHAVGIDAILNLKGYAGDHGLERYAGFAVTNLGSQVENERIADVAAERGADAILVSQIVTQRDVHKDNARQLVELLERRGTRGRFLLLLGGPRIDHGLARELGFDAGFGPGTRPSDVAGWLYGAVLARKERGG